MHVSLAWWIDWNRIGWDQMVLLRGFAEATEPNPGSWKSTVGVRV